MKEFIISALTTVLGPIVDIACAILPQSPFLQFNEWLTLNKYISNIQYFLPISEAVAVLEAWVACIIFWYVYRFIRRAILIVSNTGLIPL